jgi:hypothetical protein
MCGPTLRTSSMRSHDESGKTSVEHADGRPSDERDRAASTSDQWLGWLIHWFDPHHDFCHAKGGLMPPFMAHTNAVRDEQ